MQGLGGCTVGLEQTLVGIGWVVGTPADVDTRVNIVPWSQPDVDVWQEPIFVQRKAQ